MHGNDQRIHHGAGFRPRLTAPEPVEVGVGGGHALRYVQIPCVRCDIGEVLIARVLVHTQQSAHGRERCVCLRFDFQLVYAGKAFRHLTDEVICSHVACRNVVVGNSVDAEKCRTDVTAQNPVSDPQLVAEHIARQLLMVDRVAVEQTERRQVQSFKYPLGKRQRSSAGNAVVP